VSKLSRYRQARTLLVPGVCLAAIVLTTPSAGENRLEKAYAQIFCTKLPLDSSEVPAAVRAKLENPMPWEVTDLAARKWRVTDRGLSERTATGKEIELSGRDGLPLLKLTGIVAGPDGRLWIATAPFAPSSAFRWIP